jgi:hypothetical protein
MGKAFELPKNAKCGECRNKIVEGDLYTIIYEDDDSGKIKHLLCDNCEVDDRIQEYRDTGEVSSDLSLKASMANYHYTLATKSISTAPPSCYTDMSNLRKDLQHFYEKYKKDLLEIAAGNDKIQNLINQFENKHWLPYLKKYWNDTDQRGHGAKVGKTNVMMWGSAGRVLITVECDKTDITMIFSDEKSQVKANGGQQGIHGSQKTVQEILQELVNADKINFKANKAVTIAGL